MYYCCCTSSLPKEIDPKDFVNDSVFLRKHQDCRLHYLKLREVPADLFTNAGCILRGVNLTGNLLETLPAGIFDDLKLLRWVVLDDNRLKYLPVGLFSKNTNLEAVSLRNNCLRILPPTLFKNCRQCGNRAECFDGNFWYAERRSNPLESFEEWMERCYEIQAKKAIQNE